jgi:hypothetical protein
MDSLYRLIIWSGPAEVNQERRFVPLPGNPCLPTCGYAPRAVNGLAPSRQLHKGKAEEQGKCNGDDLGHSPGPCMWECGRSGGDYG